MESYNKDPVTVEVRKSIEKNERLFASALENLPSELKCLLPEDINPRNLNPSVTGSYVNANAPAPDEKFAIFDFQRGPARNPVALLKPDQLLLSFRTVNSKRLVSIHNVVYNIVDGQARYDPLDLGFNPRSFA